MSNKDVISSTLFDSSNLSITDMSPSKCQPHNVKHKCPLEKDMCNISLGRGRNHQGGVGAVSVDMSGGANENQRQPSAFCQPMPLLSPSPKSLSRRP